MKPILFAKNATVFTSNGIGRLDAISCTVTEERNGIFELEMEIAETSLHADAIEMTSIIVAKPSQSGSNQAFRVYKITKPINGRFKVYAQHISYQLSYVPVMPFTITASASACASTLAALKSNAVGDCPFNFHTDVTTVASYSQSTPASLRSRLGGVEGSVLDQFGGEYKWENYDVYLLAHRGLQSPAVSLRYGKNIIDLNQEENIENTITGIVPFWNSSEGEKLVTLPEKAIESPTAANFPFKRTVPYDFSQAFQEEPTIAQLRAKAQAYINQAGIGIPKVSIQLSFVSLADTEEYKNVAALQAVNLCDNVGVYFEKLDISTTAKVVKTVYNVLAEKYDSIEIGSLRSTLASTISSQDGAISTLANNTKRMFAEYNNTVGELIDNATAWLTSGGGYVIAVKNADGSWKELLFMSTNDITDTHANVLRVNQNGLGFSSTGIAGPYTQAWTLDGKMVIGGTNVPSLTVYDNQQHILFQIDKDGLQWNAPNSSMTTQGVLTMENGTIKAGIVLGATIKTDNSGARIVLDGSAQNVPTLTVYGENSDNIIFQTSKNGTIWNSTNSSMDINGNLTVNGGTITGATIQTGINGARIVLHKNAQNNPELIAYDSNGNVLFQADQSGVTVNDGIITGATIQTDDDGSRILMDSSSSLKGYYDDSLHNIINMSNRDGNNNNLIIDADHALHIRTPSVYVTNVSAGTGGTEVYQTYNNYTAEPGQDPGYAFVSGVSKDMIHAQEVYLRQYSDTDPDANFLVTLPVKLTVEYTRFQIMHGMLMSGASVYSEDISS